MFVKQVNNILTPKMGSNCQQKGEDFWQIFCNFEVRGKHFLTPPPFGHVQENGGQTQPPVRN